MYDIMHRKMAMAYFEVYINFSAITIKIPHLCRIPIKMATVQIKDKTCTKRAFFHMKKCTNWVIGRKNVR